MDFSRRDLALLLPVLTAGVAAAQQPNAANGQQGAPKGASGPPKVIDAATWDYKELKPEGAGARKLATFINGVTTNGLKLEMHLSDLGPGLAPHPPHTNTREELLVIMEGTLEVELGGEGAEFNGRKRTLGPGSVAFLASNVQHGWRNVGTTTSKYFVLTIG